jgi:Tfp pilus assembly protein PilO
LRTPSDLLGLSAVARWAVVAGPRKTGLISLLACLGLTYLLFTTTFQPRHEDNREAAGKLAQFRAQNSADQVLADSMPQFLEEVQRAEEDYAVARQLLPDAPEVSVILQAVQKLATARKVRLTVFHDTGGGAKSALADKLNERVVPIELAGDHLAIARFLGDIASYPRVLHIRDVSITAQPHAHDELVNATLVSYYAPSPQDLPQLPEDVQQTLSTKAGGSK